VDCQMCRDVPSCLLNFDTLIERKLSVPQIQGVQGRMPYAAASQQPSTASFGMLLCTQEPDMVYHRLSLRVNKMEKKQNHYN